MRYKTVCIRIPEEYLKKIDEIAKREGIKRSQLIRKIIIKSMSAPPDESMGIVILNKKIKMLFSRIEKLEDEIKKLNNKKAR